MSSIPPSPSQTALSTRSMGPLTPGIGVGLNELEDESAPSTSTAASKFGTEHLMPTNVRCVSIVRY